MPQANTSTLGFSSSGRYFGGLPKPISNSYELTSVLMVLDGRSIEAATEADLRDAALTVDAPTEKEFSARLFRYFDRRCCTDTVSTRCATW